MNPITQSRCFQHSSREAVARCPECGRFYCRECVTEYENKVICNHCLKEKLKSRESTKSHWLAPLQTLVMGVLGLLMAWFIFYQLGKALLSIPSQFHDGTFLK